MSRGIGVRPHRLSRSPAHAGDGQATCRDVRGAAGNGCGIPNCLLADLIDHDRHLELIFEVERPTEIERCRHARKPDLRVVWCNAETCCAPRGVLGLFHVAVEPTEMNNTGCVSFVELHAAVETVPVRHGLLSHGRASGPTGSRRSLPRRTLPTLRRAVPDRQTRCQPVHRQAAGGDRDERERSLRS